MPFQRFINNGRSTLATPISSSSTASIVVQTGDGAKFPTPKTPDFFYVTLDDGVNVEICKCIDRSGDTITVLRGVENTTAQSSFAANTTRVELRWTEDSISKLRDTSFGFTQFSVRPILSVNSWGMQGVPAPTKVGSETIGTLTSSSWVTQSARMRITVGNSAQQPIEHRMATAIVSIYGGFRFQWRFGVDIAPSSSHCFIGLINTTGQVASVHPPTSMTQMAGVGWSPGSSSQNLNFYANAAGVATYWDLGSYFNINTSALYELTLEAQPGLAQLNYRVRRLDISSIADINTYWTTSIPANSLWLSPLMHAVSMVNSAPALHNAGYSWIT